MSTEATPGTGGQGFLPEFGWGWIYQQQWCLQKLRPPWFSVKVTDVKDIVADVFLFLLLLLIIIIFMSF